MAWGILQEEVLSLCANSFQKHLDEVLSSQERHFIILKDNAIEIPKVSYYQELLTTIFL